MIIKKSIEWKTREVTKRRNVQTVGEYPYRHSMIAAEAFTVYSGDIEINIDIDAITQMIAGRAGHNKSGKAAFLHGMIKGKRVSVPKVVSREEKEYPIPPTYVEVK
jgi:hypothetical protein